MGGLSLPHLLLLGVVVLILFGGKGKISEIMGDVAKGIKVLQEGPVGRRARRPSPPRRRARSSIRLRAVEPSRDANKVG